MTPIVARKVLEFFRNTPVSTETPDYGLTKRELQVLECLVKGMSYKMIAEEISVSYNTVNSHMKKISDKLHVHSIGEAISKAIHHKIV